MGRGPGIVQRTNKVETPAAPPPATVTAARNGLSLVGTNVELGSAGVNPLLHNTNVDLGGFQFSLINGIAGQLIINPSAGSYSIGDISGAVNGTFLNINDGTQNLLFQNGGNDYLLLDPLNALYQIGDISLANNSTKIDIKDASTAIELDVGTGNFLVLNGGAGFEELQLQFNNFRYFDLNPNSGNYEMGDIGNSGNNTILTLNDSISAGSISSNGFTMLFLDMVNGVFQLGASAGGTANTTYFQVDDSAQSFTPVSAPNGINGFSCSLGNIRVRLGDFSAAVNGTVVDIIDGSSQIRLTANANILFQTLAAGVNMTPTSSPFGVAALPAFANNAAAVVGGLNVGAFYRISVAGTSAVAVVE